MGVVSYSFTSTHPGLLRRTSISVFIRVALNRMEALCSLKDKATECLLKINSFSKMSKDPRKGEGRRVKFHNLEMPKRRITEFQNFASQEATLKIIKLRITESFGSLKNNSNHCIQYLLCARHGLVALHVPCLIFVFNDKYLQVPFFGTHPGR